MDISNDVELIREVTPNHTVILDNPLDLKTSKSTKVNTKKTSGKYNNGDILQKSIKRTKKISLPTITKVTSEICMKKTRNRKSREDLQLRS